MAVTLIPGTQVPVRFGFRDLLSWWLHRVRFPSDRQPRWLFLARREARRKYDGPYRVSSPGGSP